MYVHVQVVFDQSRSVPAVSPRAAAACTLTASNKPPALAYNRLPIIILVLAIHHGFRWLALACHNHQEVRPCLRLRIPASQDDHRCRLEATTSRLEDLASLATTYLPPSAQGAVSAITSPASANAEPTPVPPPGAAAQAAPAETPRSVVAFDEQVIEGKLKPFVELTKSFASQSVIEQVRPCLIDLGWPFMHTGPFLVRVHGIGWAG